jgi:pimeloyl-ACP methyl ester carboxylesterase
MPFYNCHGINIYYEVAGSGEPLLLMNGISADTRQWSSLVGFLKNYFSVISYDMSCAGKSDKPKANISIPQLSREALALSKHLGYDKINVLGFSMGGLVAQDLALSYPESVKSLILLSTAPSMKRPYPPSKQANRIMHANAFSVEHLANIYYLIFGAQYRETFKVEEYIKMKLEDENPQPREAYCNQLQALESHDLVDSVQKIQSPTLVITGDSDSLIRPDNSHWLSQQIPNAKLHILEGVGHMVALEWTKDLSSYIKEFLLGKAPPSI